MVALRLFVFALWLALMFPLLVAVRFTRVLAPSFNRMWFRVACFIFGIRVRVKGARLARRKRLLIVCNHASYLDILVLGSRFKVNFVAKSDVAGWPVFGLLCRLGGTIFISRSRMRAKAEVGMMAREMARRSLPLVIFPEGTSTDGTFVLPFKSSIFGLFEGPAPIGGGGSWVVQPVSMAYARRGERKMSEAERRVLGWPVGDDRSIGRHLADALEYSPFTVEILMHEPIELAGAMDRKELAARCWKKVDEGFRKLLEKDNL
jgi:1-acyl-sn-glycerol-3-phosphate acyltransferase